MIVLSWDGKVDPAADTAGPVKRLSSAWGSEMLPYFCLFALFLRILSVAQFEIFQKWSWCPSLFLFFTLTHWSKTWKTHMQSIKPEENETSKRQQVKGREVDISWSSSPCTHSQRIIWHIHMKGSQYERNARFHFQLLQNEIAHFVRVTLSLVVSVAYLGCSCAWDTLLGKEN